MKNKTSITFFAALILLVLIVVSYRHEIELALFTDVAAKKNFAAIQIGDSKEQVVSLMGEPSGTIENNDNQILKWPRYKDTTFAVQLNKGVVAEKYERFGS